ncbi:uncharacterized protein LOC118150136 [Callithrix jacchus]
MDLSLLIQSGSPPPPQKPTEREKCGRGDDGELGPPGPQSLHPEWLHLPLPRSPQSGRSADEETMGNWVHLDLSLLTQSGSPPPPQKPTEREKCGRGDAGELGPPGPQSPHPEWLPSPSPEAHRAGEVRTRRRWGTGSTWTSVSSPRVAPLPLPRSPQSGRSADEETLGNWVHLDLSLLIQSGSPPPPQKPTEREKCGRGDDGELGPPGPQSPHPEWLPSPSPEAHRAGEVRTRRRWGTGSTWTSVSSSRVAPLPLPRSPQSGRSADEETMGNWVHLDLSLLTQSGSPPPPQKPTEREKCGRGDDGELGPPGPQSLHPEWLPSPSPEAHRAGEVRTRRRWGAGSSRTSVSLCSVAPSSLSRSPYSREVPTGTSWGNEVHLDPRSPHRGKAPAQ